MPHPIVLLKETVYCICFISICISLAQAHEWGFSLAVCTVFLFGGFEIWDVCVGEMAVWSRG